MRTAAIVPIKNLSNTKRRLSSFLDEGRRKELSIHMLQDVIKAILGSEEVHSLIVVSPDDEALSLARGLGTHTLKEEREEGVDEAVSRANAHAIKMGMDCTVVFPADIPLITPFDVNEVIRAGRQRGSVVIVPSLRLDGTNALLRNPPGVIRTFYEKDSFRSHLKEAIEKRLRVKVLLSRRVGLDIDTREDLLEFLSKERPCLTYGLIKKGGC